MSKFPNIGEETAIMQHDETMAEKPQDRLAGRRKFQFCPRCGSQDGMQAAHRETLAEMPSPALNWIKSQRLHWYREPGNAEFLFYPCSECNRDRVIPSGFVAMHDIRAWLDRNPWPPTTKRWPARSR